MIRQRVKLGVAVRKKKSGTDHKLQSAVPRKTSRFPMDACTLRTNTNAYFSLRPCVEALGAVPVGFLSVELHTTSAYSGLMVLTPSPGVMRDKLRSRRPPAGEGACLRPPPPHHRVRWKQDLEE